MKYEEALCVIHKTDWKGSRLGLERIRELLSRLGNPQNKLACIHVAGTNGKGSVCAFLTEILTRSGYKTGAFTSPFLEEFRERIRIGSTLISEEDLCHETERVQAAAREMEDSPTEFEFMTAIAFCYFETQKCDYVVLEVGLGGEKDSTNVIPKPLLSIITSIALDHQKELGNTIPLIARAKAGIVKEDCPVLFGQRENEEARSVIEQVANEKRAPLFLCGAREVRVQESTLSGSVFDTEDGSGFAIRLAGVYQPYNAAIALSAVQILRRSGLTISEKALREGLLETRWKGRFEILGEKPLAIIDGAHNPNGVESFCASLRACLPEGRYPALLGVMADKDYSTMLSLLAGQLSQVYAITPENPRALDADKLREECEKHGISARAFRSVQDGVHYAMQEARSANTPLLLLGSLYLYREAKAAVMAFYDSMGTGTSSPMERA